MMDSGHIAPRDQLWIGIQDYERRVDPTQPRANWILALYDYVMSLCEPSPYNWDMHIVTQTVEDETVRLVQYGFEFQGNGMQFRLVATASLMPGMLAPNGTISITLEAEHPELIGEWLGSDRDSGLPDEEGDCPTEVVESDLPTIAALVRYMITGTN